MNQLLPFMETDHYMICEFITDDLQENDDLVELTPSVKPNKKTNYFIRFKKPSFSWRYFFGNYYRYEDYAKKITEMLQPVFPPIKLDMVKRREEGEKWCKINMHSLFGIRLPSGIYPSCYIPLIKMGDERFIVIPGKIVVEFAEKNTSKKLTRKRK